MRRYGWMVLWVLAACSSPGGQEEGAAAPSPALAAALDCGALEAAACEAEPRCFVQEIARFELAERYIGEAEFAGCAPREGLACPEEGALVSDAAGQCGVLSAGCPPAGWGFVEAEGGGCLWAVSEQRF